MPNFVGQTKADAQQLGDNATLKLTFKQQPCEDQKKGNICSQDPTANTEVKKDSTVNLVVSTGAPKVTVPDVVGQNVNDVTTKLEGDDYQFKVETKNKESAQEAGTVLETDPKFGQKVEKGSTITLTVAKAVETVTVPDVTGQGCDAAKQQMQASGLTGNCTDVDTNDPNQAGKVIQTSPGKNETVKKGSTVTIQIGKQAQQATVPPNIQGQKLKDVRGMLQQAGLQVGNITGSQDDNATVIGSNPTPGSQVAPNTPVNLFTAGGGGGPGNGGNDGGSNFFGGVTGRRN